MQIVLLSLIILVTSSYFKPGTANHTNITWFYIINRKVRIKIGICFRRNSSRYAVMVRSKLGARERRHLILSLADYKCYFFERSIILREQRCSTVSNAPFSSKVFLVYHRWALRGGDFSFRFVVTPDLFNVPFLSLRD